MEAEVVIAGEVGGLFVENDELRERNAVRGYKLRAAVLVKRSQKSRAGASTLPDLFLLSGLHRTTKGLVNK